jgi:hypothetical protein
MAHKFDTGQPAPQRTRLEQGVVSLLSGLKRSAGGYLVEVMAFPFTMDTVGDEDDVRQFVMALSRAPSIAVHVGERVDEPGGIGGFSFRGEFELHVYISSNNMRSSQVGRMEIDGAGLASNQADPGLHVVMEHVRELVIGRYATTPVGADIKQARPYRERAIITAQQITIWEQLYRVKVMTQLDEFRTVTQLLESIRFRMSQNPSEVLRPAPAIDSTSIDVNMDPAGRDVILLCPGDSNLVGQVVGQPAGVDGEADPEFTIMGPVPDVGYNKHYAQASSDPVPYLTDVVGPVKAYNVAGVQNSGIQVPMAQELVAAGFDCSLYEHAISGIKAAQFAPSSGFPTLPTGTLNLWNATTARVDALGGNVRGMVWVIGGNDGFSAPDVAALPGALVETATAAIAKWPGVIIALVRSPAFQSIGGTVPQLAAVQAAQDALAAAFPQNVVEIWTDDLSGHSDHLHWDGNSAVIVAQRVAFRLLDAFGVPRVRPVGRPGIVGRGPLYMSSGAYTMPSPGCGIDKDLEILTLFSQRASGVDSPIGAPTTTGAQPWTLRASARSNDGTSTTRMEIYTRPVTAADLATGHGAMPPTSVPASGNPINGGRILVARSSTVGSTPSVAAISTAVNNAFQTGLTIVGPSGPAGLALAIAGGYRTNANANPVTMTFVNPVGPARVCGSNRTIGSDFTTHAAWTDGMPNAGAVGNVGVTFALPTLACGAALILAP